MTQDIEQQLSTLSLDTLTPIVRKSIGEESAEIMDWSYQLLSAGAINPITAGIYRFWGNAQCDGQLMPWSIILKISQWVDFTDFPPLAKDYLNEPSDWNYWKREAMVGQSDIFINWQGDLVPVKYYAVSQPTETTAWIWQEEVQELHRSVWPLERHVLAAKHFGEFHGAFANYSPSTEENAWLCRQFIRHWVRSGVRIGLGNIAENNRVWENPFTKLALPDGTQGRLQKLLADSDTFCDLLENQSQTLSHQDTHWPNLFATYDAQGNATTTVIDWSFLGLAAIGEDLGTQVAGNLANLFVNPVEAKPYYEAALDAYIDGLQQTGWHNDEKSIRFACASTAALRYATFEVLMLNWLIEDKAKGNVSWIDNMAKEQNLTVEETLVKWGKSITFLFDLADEARKLASQL